MDGVYVAAEQLDAAQLDALELADFEPLARERMPDVVRTIIDYGEELGNKAAWERWALRPRALVDISACDTSTTLLGHPLELPAMIAPHALQGLFDPAGEVATASGAARAGTITVLPTASSRTPEEVGAVGPFWTMLPFVGNRRLMEAIVQRAAAAGAIAFCLTIDYYPVVWPKAATEAVRRIGHESGLLALYADDMLDSAVDDSLDYGVTWADLDWLRSVCPVPLVLKGIMTAEDARQAVEHGVDALVVSNHAGHTMHHVLPTADVLPEVVEAVDGRIEVLVDGGIRAGVDVFRALALGADAVMFARSSLFGLALGGADGVARVLTLMREELAGLMAMTGTRTVAEIRRSTIAPRRPSAI